ncbi:hypothetical protein [Dysosmobacter sp.]
MVRIMPMTISMLLIPVLYAAVKVAAGILVLHYGKRYADKIREEHDG